jgi:hypothetical protein
LNEHRESLTLAGNISTSRAGDLEDQMSDGIRDDEKVEVFPGIGFVFKIIGPQSPSGDGLAPKLGEPNMNSFRQLKRLPKSESRSGLKKAIWKGSPGRAHVHVVDNDGSLEGKSSYRSNGLGE